MQTEYSQNESREQNCELILISFQYLIGFL